MTARWMLCVVFATAMPALAQPADVGPAPGRLVEVNGRKMHLTCAGEGSPTVILEAGASAFAIDWSLVQPAMARTNRICAYDRAGHGWSDPRGVVDTPARIVSDLRALLAATGERPPFIMVGASAGALYVRLYALDHPGDVAGMVLIDPASEDRYFTMFEQKMVTIASLTADQLLSTMPSMDPLRIPSRAPQSGPPFDRLPPDLYQLRMTLDARLIASIGSSVPRAVNNESAEGQRAALVRLRESRSTGAPLGGRPLIVLSRGQQATPGLTDAHAQLARLSTNSRHAVVAGSGHEVHLFAPDVVVQAIQDVAGAARDAGPLPPRP
jgi:pimeloyl-ACP methyl ester carboxylesterase